MNDELQEVEVKLYTPDLSEVRNALERAGATQTKPRVFERNLRYDSADGSLTAAGVVLRLRQDEKVKLTYKADASIERGIVSRFEAEVETSDFETMHVILQRLGFTVALIYEKYRTTYVLEGAEIVLDELPYGNFTEVEGDAATIERVAAMLGLGWRAADGGELRGYICGCEGEPGLGCAGLHIRGICEAGCGLGETDLTTEDTEFLRAQSLLLLSCRNPNGFNIEICRGDPLGRPL